jgi:hypothetical protein
VAKVTDFTPDPQNLNKGTERGVYMVEESLTRYGAGRSIVVDKNGIVLAGNKTQQAAIDLGIEDALVVETEGDKLVVVKRNDLDLLNDPKRAREYSIADNRASEVGLEWDADELAALALDDTIDLGAFFRGDELDAILGDLNPEPPDAPEAQTDKAEELRQKWQTELGQVWEIPSKSVTGKAHRVICGDAKEYVIENVLTILDPVYGDDISDLAKKLLISSHGILAIAWGFEVSRLSQMLGEYAFDYACEVVEGLMFAHKPIQRHKLAAFWDISSGVYNYDVHLSKEFSASVCFWHLRAKRSEVQMKYSKPVEQFAFFIDLHSRPNDTVYDPFLGSGTTIVAAERTSRICYGCEIEPKYVAVILQRMADLGLEPRLLS